MNDPEGEEEPLQLETEREREREREKERSFFNDATVSILHPHTRHPTPPPHTHPDMPTRDNRKR